MNVKELKLHQMEVIMENELSDGVISSKEPPKEHEILWEGRPFMPAYLLGGEGTLLFTIIVFAILTYWGYTLIWLDCLMAAIVLFEWIQVNCTLRIAALLHHNTGNGCEKKRQILPD